MEIKVTLEAIITLPEGTQVPQDGTREFTLPGGECIKPFVVLELNEERDLTYPEYSALGVNVEEWGFEWEGAE